MKTEMSARSRGWSAGRATWRRRTETSCLSTADLDRQLGGVRAPETDELQRANEGEIEKGESHTPVSQTLTEVQLIQVPDQALFLQRYQTLIGP